MGLSVEVGGRAQVPWMGPQSHRTFLRGRGSDLTAEDHRGHRRGVADGMLDQSQGARGLLEAGTVQAAPQS